MPTIPVSESPPTNPNLDMPKDQSKTNAPAAIRSNGRVRHYIVLWDDQMGVCCPMGWDEDCAGAICCSQKTIAIFASPKAARKAIDISTKYALLRRAQGKNVNVDFLGACRKNLRVVECVPNYALCRPADSEDGAQKGQPK